MMEIFYGALGGVGWAAIGLANELSKPAHEPMSIAKFFRSIVIGAVIGGTSPFTGIPINQVDYMTSIPLSLSATAVVDKIISMVWKQFAKNIVKYAIKPEGEKK
jgi:hypothetical protein